MTPLNKQAYLHIKKLIMTGQLSYQEIYSETKLSRELGISRTPLRDAIHRLAQEEYIDIIPSKGFILHRLTKQDIVETFQIRSALECYCALQIAKNYESDSVQQLLQDLTGLTDRLKTILETTKSIEDFCEYDFQFHKKIIEYIENKKFSSIFDTFQYRMRRLAELSLSHEGRMADTYSEHLAIVCALEQGDIEHIYEIISRHMDTARNINIEDL